VTSRRSLSQKALGAAFGLGAAALFGVSAPLAKVLVGSVAPVLLAGLLYLGAAVGLWLLRAVRPVTREAPLSRGDVGRLAGVVLSGGVLGPVAMLFGLRRVSGLTGSLLLNLEAPLTVLLAVVVFREHLGAAGIGSVLCIVSGAAALGFSPGSLRADPLGVALLASACLCWAIDNNLTQRLSLRDPFAIVRVKTLVAGAVNTALGLAFVTHGALPPWRYTLAALALGSVSYGASVVLDAYALRLVGAAREAAYFATAPFVGALASVLLLRNPLRWIDGVAMLAMIAGVALLLRERHGHHHAHERLEHEHLHDHGALDATGAIDEHHAHEHGADDPPGPKHSHWHRHAPLEHAHAHVSDEHHRHEH
jgi:drug/metabolite transporter (DMT)-like permease